MKRANFVELLTIQRHLHMTKAPHEQIFWAHKLEITGLIFNCILYHYNLFYVLTSKYTISVKLIQMSTKVQYFDP